MTEVSMRSALPGDDDVARPLGQPHGAEREQRDDDEIDEDADHCGMDLSWRCMTGTYAPAS